jgi:hypothetical protein
MPSFIPGTLHKYTFPVQNIVINANVTTQVNLSNARRIALGLYSLDSNMVIFPTSTGVFQSQISPSNSTSGGYWFLAQDVGPLCQLEWYAYTSSGGTITVLEVVEES